MIKASSDWNYAVDSAHHFLKLNLIRGYNVCGHRRP